MIAKTPAPPYYTVIFTSIKTSTLEGYNQMSDAINALVKEADGFLGLEEVSGTMDITVSYWRDLDAIKKWKDNPEHQVAQLMGKQNWYKYYKTRIAKVELDYEFEK